MHAPTCGNFHCIHTHAYFLQDSKEIHWAVLQGGAQGKKEPETSRFSAFSIISMSDMPPVAIVEPETSVASSRKAPTPKSHSVKKKVPVPGVSATVEYYKDVSV